MRVLAVINDPICDGGIVVDTLLEGGHRIVEVRPNHGVPLPTDAVGTHDAIVAFGGAMSAFDDAGHPALAQVSDALAAFTRAGKPVLGLCLGAQQIARAFGQPYVRLGQTEFGFTPFRVTEAGRADPLLAGLAVPPIAQIHGDSFVVPPDGTRLLTGANCPEQAFRIGRATYAFQAHFEVSAPTLETCFPYLEGLDPARLGPDAPARIAAFRQAIPERLPAAQAFGRTFTRRWAALAQI